MPNKVLSRAEVAVLQHENEMEGGGGPMETLLLSHEQLRRDWFELFDALEYVIQCLTPKEMDLDYLKATYAKAKGEKPRASE